MESWKTRAGGKLCYRSKERVGEGHAAHKALKVALVVAASQQVAVSLISAAAFAGRCKQARAGVQQAGG